jgi:hypothetical protein
MSFTKDHAERTAKKLTQAPKDDRLPLLEVRQRRGSDHDVQQIWCQGKWIAQFGINRGSRRNAGHDWVPKTLKLSHIRAIEFAMCRMTVDEMIQHLLDKGLIIRIP